MMKRSFAVLCFLFALNCAAYAQGNKSFTILPGENILSVIPSAERMAFPDFQRGVIFFENGARSTASLNVSFLTQELLFINATGDTLSLSNAKEVKWVQTPSDPLYNASGRFVKKDTVIGNFTLAVNYAFSTGDRRKVGAFGTTTDGATDSYIALDAANIGITDVTPQVKVVLLRKPLYYLGNSDMKFLPAGKKQFTALFPGKQALINRYLQENQVNFSSRSDLIALLAFLQQP